MAQPNITSTHRRHGGITRNSEQIAVRLPHNLKNEIERLAKAKGISRTAVLLSGARLFMEAHAMLGSVK